MTRTEERLTDALHAAAETVRPGILRPLPANYPERLRGADRPPRRRATWLVPLTAAATVATVIAVSVFVTGRGGEGGNPGGPGLGSLARVPSYSGAGAVPPKFYVISQLAASPPHSLAIQVRATRTGQLRATLPPLPRGWSGDPSVSAAADDHTFFIAAVRGTMCEGTAKTRFYRFAVNPSGAITGFGPVGQPIRGVVGSFAASPSGTQIAYAPSNLRLLCGSRYTVRHGGDTATTVAVQDLVSGQTRTWRNTATAVNPSRVVEGLWSLSWTGDGRTLVMNYHWQADVGPDYMAIRALDVTGTGGSLQRHSRLLYSQGRCRVCVYQALISPDGTTLTAVAMSGPRGRQGVFKLFEQWVLQMSATGGQPLRILYKSSHPGCGTDPVLYGDGSGRSWILKSGAQFGWIRDQRLVPLLPGLGFKISNTPGGCVVVDESRSEVTGAAW